MPRLSLSSHPARENPLSAIQLSNPRSDVVLMTLDMPNKSANVLTDQVFADLSDAIAQLEANPPTGIILFSAKPSIFVAGADLVKISQTLDWSDPQIVQFCEDGRQIMRRISQLPSVSVAAIHGVCVGGGMELTLWCDHRIVSDHPRTLLGLPEVKLGLVPGWAGTVRLPRLIGLEAAVELTTSARLIDAATTCELGIALEAVPQANLIDRALEIIDQTVASQDHLAAREKLLGSVPSIPADTAQLEQQTKQQIEANSEIGKYASEIVLEHMLRTASVDAEEACDSESRAMAKVYGSPDNIGLLHYFFLDERAKKTRAQFDEGTKPDWQTIGLVGAGLMGRQIAQLILKAGWNVVVYDANPQACEELVATVAGDARLQIASSLEELRDTQLVIESVVEKRVVKQKLLKELCQILAPETFLFSNTSALPIQNLASAVANPARFAGLHFCCPVEPMRLVEIIRGEHSAELTMNAAIELTRKIRKTPVVMNDACGFVVNRLLCPMFDQALVMLRHGIDCQRIDRIFKEFGFAAGPLEMIDFIGVDTIMYAGETFLQNFPEHVTLTPILPALVKRGWHGRKAGRGFYDYAQQTLPPEAAATSATNIGTVHGQAVGVIDDTFSEVLSSYQKETWSLTDTAILEKLLSPMANAGRALLEEGVVEDSRDIDLCSILGTTFPKEKGGLLFWANSQMKS